MGFTTGSSRRRSLIPVASILFWGERFNLFSEDECGVRSGCFHGDMYGKDRSFAFGVYATPLSLED
jgi:hypothetical protein